MWRGIVALKFKPDAFEVYVKQLHFTDFVPQFIVLHNTGEPSLAQRPNGLTLAHMHGLESYYRDVKHWSAGPHLFCDQSGIWVFTDLRKQGTHSFDWNPLSWGVEMLGDYATEPFDKGPGALVAENAVQAVAILSMKRGFDSSSMRLHKENKRTDHDCPGKNVNKAAFIRRVHDEIVRRRH